MKIKTLITPWEVVKYSPVSNKYPTRFVENHIYQSELSFARDFLGMDNYNNLLNSLVDYGKLEEYEVGTTYANEVFVIFAGTVIQSQIDNNGIHPCDDANGAWKEAKKFNNNCLNEFWTLHLREYLAFLIIGKTLEYSTYNVGASGVVDIYNENSGVKTASYKSFVNVKGKVIEDAHERLKNMEFYIASSTCISLPLSECTQNRKKHYRGRRIAFKQ